MERRTSRYAGMTLRVVEDIGLTVIGLATIVAGWHEVQSMFHAARVTLADLRKPLPRGALRLDGDAPGK